MTKHVLVVGKSPAVLADTKVLLRDKGYVADATSRFDDVLADFDVSHVDVVVFGGQVPADTKAKLMEAMRARNPAMIFVQGLSGNPPSDHYAGRGSRRSSESR